MTVSTFQMWVQAQLSEQGWSMREAAFHTGVDGSNIGMLLNGRIQQPTVRMAVRLCKGFGISLPMLLESWLGKTQVAALRRTDAHLSAAATLNDVRVLIEFAQSDWTQTCSRFAVMLNWVCSYINPAQKILPSDALIFEVNDAEKLLYNSPLYTFELQYPHAFSSDAILSLYRERGALLFKDAGQYLRLARHERMREGGRGRHLSLEISPSSLSRLESGESERLLLMDLLVLDEQLGQDGQLLGVYWDAFEFYESLRSYQQSEEKHAELFGPWKDDVDLAVQFLILCRWLHLLCRQDLSWIGALRELWAVPQSHE